MSTEIANFSSDGSRTGRVNQRMRTRQAILEAANRLVEEGRAPTVSEAADAAAVSRATAYRYFPSQEELLAECALQQGVPSPDELFGRPDAPGDPEERVVFVHDFLDQHIRQREALFRQFLRRQLLRGLEDGPTDPEDRALRPGFRVGLLEAALRPVADDLGPRRLERLVHALSVLIGTEAVIVSKDVLHLDEDTAPANTEWACRHLVRAALAEAAAADSRR
jgi:AcrR family transcriptional regulator